MLLSSHGFLVLFALTQLSGAPSCRAVIRYVVLLGGCESYDPCDQFTFHQAQRQADVTKRTTFGSIFYSLQRVLKLVLPLLRACSTFCCVLAQVCTWRNTPSSKGLLCRKHMGRFAMLSGCCRGCWRNLPSSIGPLCRKMAHPAILIHSRPMEDGLLGHFPTQRAGKMAGWAIFQHSMQGRWRVRPSSCIAGPGKLVDWAIFLHSIRRGWRVIFLHSKPMKDGLLYTAK